ncbi:MAG: hypothetical protein NXY57DRAFT_1007445 [Lentinula lateritia]|uniref:Uncharacterized protein n=1 Tax=Lentinula lateritia TaxID=40482 RepID=A0ABQ8VXJ7_9AGAR|nr:MAG: hypothetical protein NXY57DRAFT_1007445 [Lentinula lateritia]KAJ4501107.1 hypothetical protein C8R41DRAFT_285892 [Lentinula lateritia]
MYKVFIEMVSCWSTFIFALILLPNLSIVAAVLTSDQIPFSEYRLLFGLCRDEGPTAHVAVRYKGYAYATLHYDECHPAEARDWAAIAEVAVVCRAAICYEVPRSDHQNFDDSMQEFQLPWAAPFIFGPGDVVTQNGTDFPHILGGSAMCSSPTLSF